MGLTLDIWPGGEEQEGRLEMKRYVNGIGIQGIGDRSRGRERPYKMAYKRGMTWIYDERGKGEPEIGYNRTKKKNYRQRQVGIINK